ncbi:DNA alkylation repair protein [Muriicola sp.]|uniref:DNA alkylation repair protein n=1 Tax=Muriicola sp. TaxID=2020856 RepID=UPI003C724068
MRLFIKTLQYRFKEMANTSVAAGQKAYMRNQFDYYGVKTPGRRQIQKELFKKELLPPKHELSELVRTLWELPEREHQYIAQELAKKYLRQIEEDDIVLYEHMILHKSWWDTVDFIAATLVGAYFKSFPHTRDGITQKWLASNNIWLQRSCLLFQLKYKETLDTVFLAKTISSLLGSEEFFINKAIGWVLREYSKTKPEWVLQFVADTSLNSLSKREALRLIP